MNNTTNLIQEIIRRTEHLTTLYQNENYNNIDPQHIATQILQQQLTEKTTQLKLILPETLNYQKQFLPIHFTVNDNYNLTKATTLLQITTQIQKLYKGEK